MHVSSSMPTHRNDGRRIWRTAAILFIAALVIQLAAIVAIARLRGSAAVYAYQSPDATEYVSLARGLAWYGRYMPIDAGGRVLGGPDTWRTPGFSTALSLVIQVFGDSTPALLLFQQVIAAVTVPLLYLIVRRWASEKWSFALAMIWCVDPFRIYYSLWLLAELFFVFVMLLAVWAYAAGPARGWNAWRALLMGALAGLVVLVRPIGIPLPFLAAMGIAVCVYRRKPRPLGDARRCAHAIALCLICAVGSAAVVAPWMLRNRAVTGHPGLAHQGGASLAYHKVLDVLLWANGRSAYRFDPAMQDAVRSEIDERLRQEWRRQFGELPWEAERDLTWRKLNYDVPLSVDPFVASSLLTKVSRDLLREHWTAVVPCCAVQGLSMLVFPLGLVIAPPAGAGSSPLSLLGGGGSASRAVGAAIGSAYALLLLVVLWRLWSALFDRRWPAHFFVLWPALALFVLSLPSEDPRFRLPLVPLMLILALPIHQRSPREEIPVVDANDPPS